MAVLCMDYAMAHGVVVPQRPANAHVLANTQTYFTPQHLLELLPMRSARTPE